MKTYYPTIEQFNLYEDVQIIATNNSYFSLII